MNFRDLKNYWSKHIDSVTSNEDYREFVRNVEGRWGTSFEERYTHWAKEGWPTRPNLQEIGMYKKCIGTISSNTK